MATSPEPPLTAGSLADALLAATVVKLEALVASTAPDFRLPRIYAGHPVLDDAKADLLYVLGLLTECGVEDVAGLNIRTHIPGLLADLDAVAVEGFFSYRVGETVLRLGGLDSIPHHLRDHVRAAVDTPEIIARLDAGDAIPPNFAVVAARVLLAQAALDGRQTGPELERFVERVRAMFDQQDNGWINDGMGAWIHYDIYTPDMYLFAQPLANRLGSRWSSGLAKVLADLDDVAQPGGAVVWGRSIGALGLAISIELAAASVAHDLGGADSQARWLSRAAAGRDELDSWFPGGVIAAHQRRRTMVYRGPGRRLQMTLDIYGKFLLAVLELRRRPDVVAQAAQPLWPDHDKMLHFEAESNAALWSVRTRGLEFALPMMMGFSTDYAPAPRSAGLFHHPTSGHPCMMPVISRLGRNDDTGTGETPLIPSGLPTVLDHTPLRLDMTHDGWSPNGSPQVTVGGGRRATYLVEGRTLEVRESLTFDDVTTGPVSISIPEIAGRPLDVSVSGDAHCVTRVDTSGLGEWRSFWGEIAVVHQIEIEPAPTVELTWRVTPRLRVASAIAGHAYDDALYGPLQHRLVTSRADAPDRTGRVALDHADVLHMAWPEWWSGVDPELTRRILANVAATGVKVVWTQHNLEPHMFKSDEARACYQLWAEAADAVMHHTPSGMQTARTTYSYGAHTTHHVIPHGHWGHRYEAMGSTTREVVEAEEGWGPCGLRLAVIGAPRAEKDLQSVVDAVAASTRDDIQLVMRADTDTVVPPDPRIVAERGHVSEHRFHRRLAAYDALVLPFASEGMLTTGTAFDCIGAGVAAITSDWAFFDDTFAGADIRYGTTATDLTTCIDSLTPQRIEQSARAMEDRRDHHDWATIAQTTAMLLEEVALR